jgi:thiamine-monophosphate kinase
MEVAFMTIRDIGERAFLASIQSMVGQVPGARLGFDDDASDIPLADSTHMIVKVDTFNSGSDWLPGMTEAQAGRKTAVMAMSDLAAKGAAPIASMLSLCVPKDQEANSVREMIRGYSQYCTMNGARFIGGDMGTSCETVLTAVMLGTAVGDQIVARTGARRGDIVAVTGVFGLTSVAFRILLDGLSSSDTLRSRALTAVYRPEINLRLVPALAHAQAVTATMDISDSLAITLNTIASQSNLAFSIDRLPVAEGVAEFAESHGFNLLDVVARGGEEFSLVLTVPADKWDKAVSIAHQSRAELIPIGHAHEGNGVLWESPEGPVVIPPVGYDDFKEWS